MEINVNSIINAELWPCYGSIATHGNNACKDTWTAACNAAGEIQVLSTPEQFSAFREYMADFGAWEREEISAWTETECNALMIQMVEGDRREMESALREGIAQAVRYMRNFGGRLFRGIDRNWYYYIGN